MSMPHIPASRGGVRVEHLVTSGTFSLDGGTWEVDNNVWLLATDTECLVIDVAHDAVAILDAVGDRRLVGVLAPTATTITSMRSTRCARRPARRHTCTRTTGCCGTS